MKKKLLKSIVATFALATLFGMNVYAAGEQPKNNASYYKTTNHPLIYGTVGIEIPKGEKFDVKNSLYRVFAKDFEDGDLTSEIDIKGHESINTNVPGDYIITYTVKDSHNNVEEIKVPVKVTNNANSNIKIKRVVYANKENVHAQAVGMSRGDHHDRQHLGLSLFKDSQVKVTYLDGNAGLTIQGETQRIGNEQTVPFKTIKEGEHLILTSDYNTTPFVRTPIGNELEPTLIELEILDNDITQPLALFYKGDNQTDFIENWRKVGGYGVFENESVTVMVGYNDIDNLTNPKGSIYIEKNFNEFLTWWDQVIDFFDKSVGLEINPKNLWDQNVRSKYFVSGHKGAGGSAYYGIHQVGISNGSAVSFFEYNWGGLHEVAHGYQGALKSGITLNEVSNNILGWFTQYNAIYTDYFGKNKQFAHGLRNGTLDQKEESVIASGMKWDEFAKKAGGEGVNDHLYIMINMLDSINPTKGEETWAKINSWYRKNKATSMPNYDVFAKAIAEEYKLNIIPYYEAFGIPVSDHVRTELFEKDLRLVQMAGLIVGDKTQELKTAKVLNYDYQMVNNDKFKSLALTGELAVTAKIDNRQLLEGKEARLYDGKEVVKTAKVVGGVAKFTDVPVGTYKLVMPQPKAAYESDYAYVEVKPENNTKEYAYTKITGQQLDNRMFISLTGMRGTNGIQIINNGNDTVTIVPGQSQLAYTKEGKIAEVKIVNKQGKETSIAQAINNDHFVFNEGFKQTVTIDVEKGSKVHVYYQRAKDGVKVVSTLSNENIDQLAATQNEMIYEITDKGFKLVNMSQSDYNSIVYGIQKKEAEKQIDEFLKNVDQAELNQREENIVEKSKILNAILSLNKEDRTDQYINLYNQIINGQDYVGVINEIKKKVSQVLADVDLSQLEIVLFNLPETSFSGNDTEKLVYAKLKQSLQNEYAGRVSILINLTKVDTSQYSNLDDLVADHVSISYKASENSPTYYTNGDEILTTNR